MFNPITSGESVNKDKTSCPSCGNNKAFFDDIRYETYCSSCGFVFNDDFRVSLESKHNYDINFNEGYTKNIKRKIPIIEKYHGNKSKWNRNQYKRFIKVVSTNLSLTNYQTLRTEYLIDNIKDFRPLCGNNHYPIRIEHIITSICLLLMRIDFNIIDIENNNFCRDIGLDRDRFFIIINKLQGKYGPILNDKEFNYKE